MIQAYDFKGSQVEGLNLNELKAHISDTIWVNLFNPTGPCFNGSFRIFTVQIF
jgi:hypothetical protein